MRSTITILLVLITVSLTAAVKTCNLTGKITDEHNRAVTGSILLMAGGKVKYTTTSGANGNYSFQQVTAGTYDVKVLAKNYQAVAKNGIVITNGKTEHLDFRLKHTVPEIMKEPVNTVAPHPAKKEKYVDAAL